MKQKRARPERCQSCEYCVITPSSEKSAVCELKLYGVEIWWQACKYFITRDQRVELIRRYDRGEKKPLQDRIKLEKEFYEKQAEPKEE